MRAALARQRNANINIFRQPGAPRAVGASGARASGS